MSHLSEENAAAYWLGDLGEEDQAALEEHIFSCEACGPALGTMASLILGLRDLVPTVVTETMVQRLNERGIRLRVTQVAPGQHVAVEFSRDVDMLIHVLSADLSGVGRVDLELESLDGRRLLAVEHVPFDVASGRVQVACQRHYLPHFPADMNMRLVAVGGEGRRELGVYRIDHVIPV
jgi:putative zinc finger protein